MDAPVLIEPEYNPQAVAEYSSCGLPIVGRSKDSNVKDLILKAKKHLSAMGWSFFYKKKNSTHRELRYQSTTGRVYISLRTACKGLIESQNGSRVEGIAGPRKKRKVKEDFPSDIRPKKRTRIRIVGPFRQVQDKKGLIASNIDLCGMEIDGIKEAREDLSSKAKKRVGKTGFGFYPENQVVLGHEGLIGKSGDLGIEEIAGIEESTKVKKKEHFSGDRQKKRLRKDKPLGFYQEDEDDDDDLKGTSNDDQGMIRRKRKKFKPKKRIRKVDGSASRSRCMLSSLIERNIVLPGARVEYRNKSGGVLAEGRIYSDGIQCACCQKSFLLSKFEAHAGSTNHRPAANIHLDDGRTLYDCQAQLKEGFAALTAIDHVVGNDDICSFCYDGGELILCDSCPFSFHPKCVGLNGVPESELWFCPSCCCGICKQGQLSNGTAEDGQYNGQVKCEQCEHQFHIDCLEKTASFTDLCRKKWFCSEKCESLFSGLQKISGKSIPLAGNNLSWSLLKSDIDANDKDESIEICSKLSVALQVMHECFEPIKHPWTNGDVARDVIFSRPSNITRSNFKGFFTAVLERDEEVITVVTLRVHGGKFAEIPLVATRSRYRRRGMCRILMEELEQKLAQLGVERFILPAVPDVIDTWTGAFGFSVMTESERQSLMEYMFLDFPGTIKCQKILKQR